MVDNRIIGAIDRQQWMDELGQIWPQIGFENGCHYALDHDFGETIGIFDNLLFYLRVVYIDLAHHFRPDIGRIRAPKQPGEQRAWPHRDCLGAMDWRIHRHDIAETLWLLAGGANRDHAAEAVARQIDACETHIIHEPKQHFDILCDGKLAI